MRRWKVTRRIVLVAMAACLLCGTAAEAKKPGGGGEAAYTLLDLLGFPDNGYQSRGMYITQRDRDNNVMVYGDSRLYPTPQGGAVFHPALWHVGADGSFPETEPVDLGLPAWAAELRPTGLNSFGVGVGTTGRAVEKDAQGNWVFPSYVDVPGISYQELPSALSRNTSAQSINDAGEIVGTHAILDPDDPDGLAIINVGAVWQLNLDGISDPTNLGDFYPRDINNSGVIAGLSGGYPAIAWFEGETLVIDQLDTSLRFWGADVYALNDYPSGDDRLTVVGRSFRNEEGDYQAYDYMRGFAWRPFNADAPSTVLGTLGGRSSGARDVNNSGQIVGWADTRRHGQQAFVYKDGQMLNLNTMVEVAPNTLNWAYGINNDGDIIGFMKIPRPVSESRGFLLRPIE